MTSEISLIYGHCQDCNKQLSAAHWCDNCEKTIMRNNFEKWTSGSSIIDNFIKHTQLKAKENMDYLEWIDFDQFELVNNTNKQGAFSTIYSAFWLEGPKLRLEEDENIWTRSGPTKVILKRLNNSQYMNPEYVDQLYRYHRCLQGKLLADCFGMTKDPSSCYMIVMGYYQDGNLYDYLNSLIEVLSWGDIIDVLLSISAGLNFFHGNNVVHGHLHGGNILIEDDTETDGIEAKIADIGLHGPINEHNLSKNFYGVVPFIAPEIFYGNSLTKASDIYSFGMIMWMLSAGVRPYYDRPHDDELIHEICSGLRPKFVEETPPAFANLMSKCLDTNPLNRPTACQVYELLDEWILLICNVADANNIAVQFDSAEEFRFINFKPIIYSCHNDAIYYSRSLNLIPM